MAGRGNLLLLALCITFVTALSGLDCPKGFESSKKGCIDEDECADNEDYPDLVGPCGEDSVCQNMHGSFQCRCKDGFRSSTPNMIFSASATCRDINECLEDKNICGRNATCYNSSPYYSCVCLNGFISSTGVETFRQGENITCDDIDECEEEDVCGPNAKCVNTPANYHCVCNAGFGLKSGKSTFSWNQEQCEDICFIDKTICGNGTCHRGASGHYCACHPGFSNYGNNRSRCIVLKCDAFKDVNHLTEKSQATHDLVAQLKNKCLELAKSPIQTEDSKEDSFKWLQRLLSMIDELLSSGALNDNRKVSTFLDIVESTLRLISPFIETPGANLSSTHTDLRLLVHKGAFIPRGAASVSSEQARLDTQLETAAGDPSDYPGFTTLSMLSYGNLETFADGFFGDMKPLKNQSLKINSRVVTVAVSNLDTDHLQEPVRLTLYHLKPSHETSHCVFWNSSVDGGAWSARGCSVVESEPEYTVCSCTHLSSFAVLLALHKMENTFELQLITWIGLSLSLVCLLPCILTFWLIRPIQSPRTTIHLHLCISLFTAGLIFLAGITRTENRVGCAVVAGLLHFFYLAAFCWMCLEGIQLFRMVVLVFNTSFKSLYMMAAGYGVPAAIVTISALANAKGYGTEGYCWLNLDFIWSFFGPVCFIIVVNVFFFVVTVWKLAQKFSSLNPDLDSLQKIKAFTITAVAQLCVLGTVWIFGCFQFDERTIAMSYIFTLLSSLQGVMLFVMHCLLSKQIRDEYARILARLCAPQKKRYSDFSSTNSSKAHASKSSQNTGQSHMLGDKV